MMIRKPAAAALAAACALALACGGNDAPPAEEAAPAATEQAAAPAPAGLDPCGLLTAAEAQEIIGKPVAGPNRNQTNNQVCEFTIGEQGMSGTFNFMTDTWGADETVEQLKGANIATTDVPGIGDRSFWAPQMGMTQLNTFKGGNHIILTMLYMGADEAASKDLVQKLMQKVVSRL